MRGGPGDPFAHKRPVIGEKPPQRGNTQTPAAQIPRDVRCGRVLEEVGPKRLQESVRRHRGSGRAAIAGDGGRGNGGRGIGRRHNGGRVGSIGCARIAGRRSITTAAQMMAASAAGNHQSKQEEHGQETCHVQFLARERGGERSGRIRILKIHTRATFLTQVFRAAFRGIELSILQRSSHAKPATSLQPGVRFEFSRLCVRPAAFLRRDPGPAFSSESRA